MPYALYLYCNIGLYNNQCDPRFVCPEENMYSTAGEPPVNSIDSTLRVFKDSVLTQTAFGQHVIFDYYYCGDILIPNSALGKFV